MLTLGMYDNIANMECQGYMYVHSFETDTDTLAQDDMEAESWVTLNGPINVDSFPDGRPLDPGFGSVRYCHRCKDGILRLKKVTKRRDNPM